MEKLFDKLAAQAVMFTEWMNGVDANVAAGRIGKWQSYRCGDMIAKMAVELVEETEKHLREAATP